MSDGSTLRVAARVRCTSAEGPFRRYALWVQGCSLRCAGCCNPQMFAPEGGELVAIDDLTRDIATSASELDIEGITILGGEPLEQLRSVAALAEQVSALGLGVIVFSGYRFDEATQRPDFLRLWSALDTLIDDRFDAGRPEDTRRYIGSNNQRLAHRTPRYSDPNLWRGSNHAEVRIAPDGTISVHGFPRDTAPVLRAMRRRT